MYCENTHKTRIFKIPWGIYKNTKFQNSSQAKIKYFRIRERVSDKFPKIEFFCSVKNRKYFEQIRLFDQNECQKYLIQIMRLIAIYNFLNSVEQVTQISYECQKFLKNFTISGGWERVWRYFSGAQVNFTQIITFKLCIYSVVCRLILIYL